MFEKPTLIIGHRGAGKSSLLKRVARYMPDAVCIDLDTEIEKIYGPIRDIFTREGENRFREIECETFEKVRVGLRAPAFVAVGGGFNGSIPEDWNVLWAQRNVDLSSYFFNDRPVLGDNPSDLRVPRERFLRRQSSYAGLATEELMLAEGEFESSAAEAAFFKNQITEVGADLTLLPEVVDSPHFQEWLGRRLSWGFHAFELRDDLLSRAQLLKAFELIPPSQRLFSFRKEETKSKNLDLADASSCIDWSWEWGLPPAVLRGRFFHSLHSEAKDFERDLEIVKDSSIQIKWSPMVRSFQQLRQGHEWAMENPEMRAFLPRSPKGRWHWYRLAMKGRSFLNFVREGQGSAPDQPTLMQWVTRQAEKPLAAVLGAPVHHSWTPAFHHEFFKGKGMDVTSVDMAEEEFSPENLAFLFEMGFRAFAVTSPLKLAAARLVHSEQPINTLAWSQADQSWVGTNTDRAGFQALLSGAQLPDFESIAVWGGGGMLPVIREQLPKAVFYSARTGEPREGREIENPRTVVWASSADPQPPAAWKPEVVIDLSYRRDSPGLEYAFKTGARYVDGRALFIEQAQHQQNFWRQYEFQ